MFVQFFIKQINKDISMQPWVALQMSERASNSII